MSCWVGKDARESFLGKSSHVPALSDAANLLERSSLEKSYFLRHAAFPPSLLQHSLLTRQIFLIIPSFLSRFQNMILIKKSSSIKLYTVFPSFQTIRFANYEIM